MAQLTKKQLQAIETRQKLIDAGRICFLKHGFQKCTMKDIIQEAGVGYGTAYVYFKNKDDLFIELIDYIMQDLIEVANLPFEPKNMNDALTMIREQTTSFLTKGLEKKQTFRLIEEALRLSESVRLKWKVVQQTFISQIEKDIRYVQKQQLVKETINPYIAAKSWYMLNEGTLWSIIDTDNCVIEDYVHTITTMYTLGIYE